MNFLKQNQKALRFTALSLSSVLALAACGPKAANFSILAAGQGTFQGSTANNKVDILWVIDNSGSMLTKQQRLATGFNSFSSVFVNKGFDFNMAIVTSDTRAVAAGGQAGQFQGAPSVITESTLNFANVFQNNVQVGQTGDSAAKEIQAIELATGALLSTTNTGFLRSDAHLAVIILSDADDNDSAGAGSTTTTLINHLNTLKPDLFDVISRTYKKNYTVSAVAVNSMTDTDCYDMDKDGAVDNDGNGDGIPDVQLYEEGVKFKTLVNATNGSFASICKADFSDGLNTISQRIAEAITEIKLARVPQVSTISVLFNGNSVPQDATHGWTYDSSGNKIVFHGNYIPMDNTSIQIGYIPNDIIR